MLKITQKICKKLLCVEDFDLGSDSSLYLCGLVKQSAVRTGTLASRSDEETHLMSLFARATPSGVPRDPITLADWTFCATTEPRLLFSINSYFSRLL